jgi:hypothetical protein
MWDLTVVTGQTILADRPGIVLLEKGEKACLLIDIAILDDSNINKKKKPKNYTSTKTWRMRSAGFGKGGPKLSQLSQL